MVENVLVAIDQGTTSSRVILFSEHGNVITCQQMEHTQIYPKPGWVEHDPLEILKNVEQLLEQSGTELSKLNVAISTVKAVGVTNQRETTVVWDKTTGKPLHNAIVWLDTRTSDTVAALAGDEKNKDRFREVCGLPLSTYFSGTKLKWLIDNVAEVRESIEKDTCLFGTIDTWLIWNLTGGVNGGVHVTDVTNASRTMLTNISTLQWDEALCKDFNVPLKILPKITSSAQIYGHLSSGVFLGVPLSACLGDQHAACVGQGVRTAGQVKNTYGTGCFLLMSTGTKAVQSTHGLLTTVAYQLGPSAPPVYALEGSIAIAGAAVQWLRDNLNLISSSSEIEALASSVADTGDVYFVPAFSGLFAPHWRTDARGVIVGLSSFSTKAHIARAVLEAVCFQTCDILEAMQRDSKTPIGKMRVDGGMTGNSLCMQLQADFINAPVVRPSMTETTALGVALAAGLAVGVYKSEEEMWGACDNTHVTTFTPQISEEDRHTRRSRWNDAVTRTLNWAR